jgi:hypothetical protein
MLACGPDSERRRRGSLGSSRTLHVQRSTGSPRWWDAHPRPPRRLRRLRAADPSPMPCSAAPRPARVMGGVPPKHHGRRRAPTRWGMEDRATGELPYDAKDPAEPFIRARARDQYGGERKARCQPGAVQRVVAVCLAAAHGARTAFHDRKETARAVEEPLGSAPRMTLLSYRGRLSRFLAADVSSRMRLPGLTGRPRGAAPRIGMSANVGSRLAALFLGHRQRWGASGYHRALQRLGMWRRAAAPEANLCIKRGTSFVEGEGRGAPHPDH